MFIRPVGTRVEPARRPSGHPLLQGLLTRAAGAPARAAEPAGTEVAEHPARSTAPEGRTATGHPGGRPTGLATELAQLANLAREGLLTPQEFKEAKTRLLHS
ncbi:MULTISPECIES: SHOCT domain-containing protein [unclassified Streptomyces]|uniref:SHOCT domain-containing protein n=1 Tax=unclassified Streptomyces TaxID=2593676 RepID=UPI0004CA416A|nr:SHOCT domain-containing protein [Streptomyces sp. NRRL F-2747]